MKTLFKYSLLILIILYVTTWFYSKPTETEGFENDLLPPVVTPPVVTPPVVTPPVVTPPVVTPPEVDQLKTTFLKELRGISDKLSDMVHVLEKSNGTKVRETYKDEFVENESDSESEGDEGEEVEVEVEKRPKKSKREKKNVIEGFSQDFEGVEKYYGGFSFSPI